MPSMLMWGVWLCLAALGGIALYIVLPWVAARVAGREWIDRVANAYVWFAQASVNNSAIDERDGTLTLVAKRFDSEINAYKDSAYGDERHHSDNFSVLSRLANKTFGLTLSARGEYVSPLLAEIGEKAFEARETGELARGGKDKDGDETMRDGILIDGASRLVNLSRARHLTTGAAPPEYGSRSYEYTKISQEKFWEKMSFGQTMIIVIGTIGSMIAMWYMTSNTGGAGGAPSLPQTNTTTVSTLFLVAIPAFARRGQLRKVGGVTVAIAGAFFIPVIAFLLEGIILGIVVTIVMGMVAVGFPLSIALGGPTIPKIIGLPLARMHWILAQLTVGEGCLARRETGEYEYHPLLEADEDADHDYETVLSNGKTLEIKGSRGDLYRFAWSPLAITEEKGEVNLGPIVDEAVRDVATDGGSDTGSRLKTTNDRQGYHALLAIPDADEHLVTGPQLYSWCQGTAESDMVERGRDKALGDHGGQQQAGTVMFSVLVLVGCLVGGLFGWIAAGGAF